MGERWVQRGVGLRFVFQKQTSFFKKTFLKNLKCWAGDGVGDDLASFAYDGWRHKVWNAALPAGHRDYATGTKF